MIDMGWTVSDESVRRFLQGTRGIAAAAPRLADSFAKAARASTAVAEAIKRVRR